MLRVVSDIEPIIVGPLFGIGLMAMITVIAVACHDAARAYWIGFATAGWAVVVFATLRVASAQSSDGSQADEVLWGLFALGGFWRVAFPTLAFGHLGGLLAVSYWTRRVRHPA
jgi:hypothetical protein